MVERAPFLGFAAGEIDDALSVGVDVSAEVRHCLPECFCNLFLGQIIYRDGVPADKIREQCRAGNRWPVGCFSGVVFHISLFLVDLCRPAIPDG